MIVTNPREIDQTDIELRILAVREDVRKLVGRVLRLNAPMYSPYPDLGIDYLEHEITQRVLIDLPKFRPEKSKFGSWVCSSAYCDLYDICRSRRKRDERDERIMLAVLEGGAIRVHVTPAMHVEPDGPREWLAERLADHLRENPDEPDGWRKSTGRPKTLSAAQFATLVEMRIKFNLSIRALWRLFNSNPAMAKALGVKKLPHYTKLAELTLSVAKLAN